MYREEFTRRWHEDQFPNQPGRRQLPYQGGSDLPYRPSGNHYLSNGVPLPVQTESGLHGPAVRRNPIQEAETRFMGDPGYGRRSYAASEGMGIDNRGYSGNNLRGSYRKPYESNSVAGDHRTDSMYMYRGKRPSEPIHRLPRIDTTYQEDHRYDDLSRNYKPPPSSVHSNAPAWVKSLKPEIDGESDKRRLSIESDAIVKDETSTGYYITIRILIICFAIWDLVVDWIITSSGPIGIFGVDNSNAQCNANNKTLNGTIVSVTNTTFYKESLNSLCKNTNDIWTLAAVFSLLGSLLTILQIINIAMEIVKRRNPQFFQILQGQSEICFIMVFEELPQSLMLSIFLVLCDCTSVKSDLHIYTLLASISACLTMTLRYASCFDGISGEHGCCNTWWRCCCCRSTRYFCRLQPKECCCTCDMPCPLCCCTLGCNMCKYTPKTWCASLMKAFSCFCGCCSTDEENYGLRIMNNCSLFLLWACLFFQIFIVTSMAS